MQKFFLFVLFFYGFFLGVLNAKAATEADLSITYPTNFGSVLVGGASIWSNSIQWVGNQPADKVTASSGVNAYFGFTGNVQHSFGDGGSWGIYNTWLMDSPQKLQIVSYSSKGPSIGYYFAPSKEGVVFEKNNYTVTFLDLNSSTIDKDVPIQGKGVMDEEASPKLTLDVKVEGGTISENCSDMSQCKYIDVKLGSDIVFTVTSQSKDDTVKYAYLSLGAEEINNSCNGPAVSFTKVGITQESFGSNDYYQVLDGFGPNTIQYNCIYSETAFLRSIGKSFQYKATNIRETKAGGYAQYRFYLNGHWDTNDTNNTKWPGSNIVYRLRTSNSAVVQPQNPVVTANITVKNDNTSSVTLDGSNSKTSVTGTGAGIASYQWTVNGSINANNTSTLTLTQEGSYSVSLQVTDSAGNQSTKFTYNQPVTVAAPTSTTPVLTANFTPIVNGQTVTADASSNTTAKSFAWSITNSRTQQPVVIQNPFASSLNVSLDAGNYAIKLTSYSNVNQTGSSLDSSVQSITINAATTVDTPVISFEVTAKDMTKPLNVTLDASKTTNSTGIQDYTWLVTKPDAGTTDQLIHMLIDHKQVSSVTLPQAGNYTVTLVITDTNSKKTSLSRSISVTAPPTAGFKVGNATTSIGNDKVTVTLDASSLSTTSDGTSITSYQWVAFATSESAAIFSTASNALTNVIKGAGNTVTAVLSNATDYIIQLAVTNSNNVSGSTSQVIKFLKPVADFIATPVTLAKGQTGTFTISLDASQSYDPDNNGKIVSYEWYTFDTVGTATLYHKEGTGKITMQPMIIGKGASSYKIGLIVIDDEGTKSDIISKTVAIPENNLQVNFCLLPDNNKLIVANQGRLTLNISCSTGPDIVTYAFILKKDGKDIPNTPTIPRSVDDKGDVSLPIADLLPGAAGGGGYTFNAKVYNSMGLLADSGTGLITILPEIYPVPPVPPAAVIDPNGNELPDAKARFFAGIFKDGSLLTSSIPSNDFVQFAASILVDPLDKSKPADILAVLCNPTQCWEKNGDKFANWANWNINISQLKGIGVVPSLQEEQTISLWNGTLAGLAKALPGNNMPMDKYLLFLGYRLDGKLVYSVPAYSFTISP